MASITPLLTIFRLQDGLESMGAQSTMEPREPDPNAQDQAPGGFFGSPLMPLMMILFLAFLIFGGGDKKRRKKREEMLSALKKGEEVMTTGGLFGHISKIDEDVVTLVVADGVRMRFASSAIQGPAVEPDKDKDKAKDKAEDKAEDKDKDKAGNGEPTAKASLKAKA